MSKVVDQEISKPSISGSDDRFKRLNVQDIELAQAHKGVGCRGDINDLVLSFMSLAYVVGDKPLSDGMRIRGLICPAKLLVIYPYV
jgi:hypothetical protein